MKNIKVSVICITYNHEKYIEECIQSLVNQKTSFEYEIIIHDDASTDNTANIIKKYANLYPNKIKAILQTENQYSKKIGISKTYVYPLIQGKYCAYCEGDDYWCDINKLQMQYDILESNNEITMCTNTVQLINESGKLLNSFVKPKDDSVRIFNKKKFFKEFRINPYPFQTSSFLIRKDTLFTIPDFLMALNGDMRMMFWSVLSGNIFYIKKVMSCYRQNVPGSYNERIKKENVEMKLQRELNSLNVYDEILKYSYDEELAQYIYKMKYDCYVFSKNKCYTKNEIMNIKNKLSLYQRLRLRLKYTFIGLILKKLKIGYRKIRGKR